MKEQHFKTGEKVVLHAALCTPMHGHVAEIFPNENTYGHKYKFVSNRGETIYTTHGLSKV